jgi:hypothetical protein
MPADSASPELASLQRHVQHCALARGRLHGLRCTGEWLNGFMAPRFCTTLTLMLVLLVALCLPVLWLLS